MDGSGHDLVLPSRMVEHRRCNNTQRKSGRSGNQATGANGPARTARHLGGLDRKKKCRHCGVKKSNADALSTHRVHSESGWTLAKPGGTSQVSRAATTSRGAAAICLWIRSSTHGSAPLDKPSAGSSGPVEVTKQIKHVERELQQSAHRRACVRGVEEIVGTTAHRAEDAAESSTTSEEGAGECERRHATSTEERRGSKRCVHVGTIRQGASGPRSIENTV